MESKACKRCDEVKPFDQFYRWKLSKDGRADWCKACRSSHDKSVAPATAKRFSKWYAQPKNKARLQANTKRWVAEHPERHRIYQNNFHNARRAAVLASTDTPLTPAEWLDILLLFNHACAYCLRSDVPLEQEHMMPISRGGSHTADNIIPACRSCNAEKNNKSLLEFVIYQTQQAEQRLLAA